MVNAAKLVLIFAGLFVTIVFRAKSSLLFTLGLIVLFPVSFLILTGHQGAALEISAASFFILTMSIFRYLVEINGDEK